MKGKLVVSDPIPDPHLCASIVDVVEARALRDPDRVHFQLSQTGDGAWSALTARELWIEACAYANALAQRLPVGARVILAPSSLREFICALYGAFIAGVIAVPTYPIRSGATGRKLGPHIRIAGNCEAAAVVLDASVGQDVRDALQAAVANPIAWVEAGALSTLAGGDTLRRDGDIAFLQYTSGSTGAPKGVIVSNANVMANSLAVRRAMDASVHTRLVSWLPAYHDMGLIGSVIQTMYTGHFTAMMPPQAFAQKPMRWLRAITDFEANISGGPNFAYDLCVDRVTAEEQAELKLATWRTAYNGSEPVRARTLERFSARFGRNGFSKSAFMPCYGLAEATLIVTAEPPDRGATLLAAGSHPAFKPDAPVVSAGVLSSPSEAWIADAETGARVADGTVGEICVAGACVSTGYWNRETETRQAFLLDPLSGVRFVRTGDLGYMEGDRLFVAGRIKQLIKIRGRALYPHDIEESVQEAHPALARNGIAVFSVEKDASEALVVLAELSRGGVKALSPTGAGVGSAAEIRRAIRRVVSDDFDVGVSDVVLLRPGSILKTSSGKVRRNDMKHAFLGGELASAMVEGSPPAEPVAPLLVDDQRVDALCVWLRDYATRRINSLVIDERRTIPPYIVMDFAERGLLGMSVAQADGGLGFSHRQIGQVMQQLAAIDLTLALFVGLHNSLGTLPVRDHAAPALRGAVLHELAGGRALGAFALTEHGAGSDPRALAAEAVQAEDGSWRLSGVKIWTGSAGWSKYLNVFAKAYNPAGDALGSIALLVRHDSAGVEDGPEALTMGLRGMIQNEMRFVDVHVPADHVLGAVGEGLGIAAQAIAQARLGILWICVGALKGALCLADRYASQRMISTGLLADNVLTQARMSEHAAAAEALECLALEVSAKFDAYDPWSAALHLDACKVLGPELLWSALDDLSQLIGGRSYIESNHLARLVRDARSLRVFEGPTETLLHHLSSLALNAPDRLDELLRQSGVEAAFAEVARESRSRLGDRAWQAKLYPLGRAIAMGLLQRAVRLRRAQEDRFAWVLDWTERKTAEAVMAMDSGGAPRSRGDLDALLAVYRAQIGTGARAAPPPGQHIDPLLASAASAAPDMPKRAPAFAATASASFGRGEPAVESNAAGEAGAALSRGDLRVWLIDWIARKTSIPPNEIFPNEPFSAYGLDSVSVEEMINDLEKLIGSEIDPTLAWEFPTIEGLAEWCARHHGGTVPIQAADRRQAGVAAGETLRSALSRFSRAGER